MSKNGDLLDQLSDISIRRILLHPVFLFLVATIVLMTSAISAWNRYRTDIVQIDQFQLTKENIVISTPQPVWTGSADIRQLVLDQYPEGEANTLDANLVPATANLFQSIGWVESVSRVEKSRNALEVDLTYRDPVALVKIGGSRPWLPIDRNAVIFDGEMLRNAMPYNSVVDSFLLIYVFQPDVANLNTWQVWPDQRIRGAADISSVIAAHWRMLGIKQIVSLQEPGELAPMQEYQLRPRNGDEGTVVIWGNAPGTEVTGEASAAEKLAAISAYVLKNGSLEQSQGKGMVLDVRSGRPVLGVKVRTANQQVILKSFK